MTRRRLDQFVLIFAIIAFLASATLEETARRHGWPEVALTTVQYSRRVDGGGTIVDLASGDANDSDDRVKVSSIAREGELQFARRGLVGGIHFTRTQWHDRGIPFTHTVPRVTFLNRDKDP
jgi:hypothetical protein